MSRSKNKHVVIAYFKRSDKADDAADQIKAWDKANDAEKIDPEALTALLDSCAD